MDLTATQNNSELEDIRAFLGMKKFYPKKKQITKLTSSSMHNSFSKEFKTLCNHKPTPIDNDKKYSCAAASHIWQENPTRVWNTYLNVTEQNVLIEELVDQTNPNTVRRI